VLPYPNPTAILRDSISVTTESICAQVECIWVSNAPIPYASSQARQESGKSGQAAREVAEPGCLETRAAVPNQRGGNSTVAARDSRALPGVDPRYSSRSYVSQ
jgi:hypothetical protein